MKKKSLLLGILLFFILTLPVAIYYGSQKYTQITEGRSRAGYAHCQNKTTYTANNCANPPPVLCSSFTTEDRCTASPRVARCCEWIPATTNTPTRPPTTRTPIPTQGKAGTWAHCNVDADCISNFCSATSQCVYQTSTGKCPRCPQRDAPDGDPCGCDSACNDTHCTGSTTAATSTPIKTPTPGLGITIVERGCIKGRLITVGQCVICSHGGIMTCDGPSGGSGGDPCQVKYSDGSIVSTNCPEANMIRCHCGGDAWVGGRPGVTCAQLCACAGINCDTCTPTPQNTNPPQPTDIPVVTNTPTIINTQTPSITNTPANTSAPGTCDASCDSDSNCQSGLVCVLTTGVKRCRKSDCPNESSCSCPIATPTERVIYVQQPTSVRVIAEAPITTETQRPTPKVPVSGGFFDVKALSITFISILFLTLGLIL